MEDVMGTRCLTRIVDRGREFAVIYRHMDGYPDGHGAALHRLLGGKQWTNGIQDERVDINGPAKLCAYLVRHLYDEASIYLEPPGTVDRWEDYTYTLKKGRRREGGRDAWNIDLVVEHVGLDERRVIFRGTIDEFANWKEPDDEAA